MLELSQHDGTWDKLGFCLRKNVFLETLLVSKTLVVSLILLGMTHPSVPSIHPLLQHKAPGDQLGIINWLQTGKGSLSGNIWAILFFFCRGEPGFKVFTKNEPQQCMTRQYIKFKIWTNIKVWFYPLSTWSHWGQWKRGESGLSTGCQDGSSTVRGILLDAGLFYRVAASCSLILAFPEILFRSLQKTLVLQVEHDECFTPQQLALKIDQTSWSASEF